MDLPYFGGNVEMITELLFSVVAVVVNAGVANLSGVPNNLKL